MSAPSQDSYPVCFAITMVTKKVIKDYLIQECNPYYWEQETTKGERAVLLPNRIRHTLQISIVLGKGEVFEVHGSRLEDRSVLKEGTGRTLSCFFQAKKNVDQNPLSDQEAPHNAEALQESSSLPGTTRDSL